MTEMIWREEYRSGEATVSIIFVFVFACLFVFNHPVFADVTESAKLLPSDGAEADWFGSSVAIDGDYAIAGAPQAQNGGYNSGSAYIFRRSGDSWSQVAKLTATNITCSERLGCSVSISGDYAVAGAKYDDETDTESGSAYIFSRNQGGPDNWGLVKEITASDAAAHDEFGRSVAISGDFIIVGAWVADNTSANSGSAYIFSRNQGGTNNWGQVAKLTASDGGSSDFFGYSVSISGDYVIIGAPWDDNTGTDSGSAYIFSRNQGGTDNWGQVAKITATSGVSGDYFGDSVAISGGYAVVSAPRIYPMGGEAEGSVYFFERSDETWSQVRKVTTLDGSGFYPDSISIRGNYALIGWSKANIQEPGSAYVFQRSGTIWRQIGKLTASDGVYSDAYGRSVAICDDRAIVGAEYDYDNAPWSGSAYIFSTFAEEFPWELFYPAILHKRQ